MPSPLPPDIASPTSGDTHAQVNAALSRLAAGDRSATEPLFRLLWPVLRSFAHRWLTGAHTAEDVAQRALLRVFEQASEFDPARNGITWALEITLWEARSERKRLGRSHEGTEPIPTTASASRPDDDFEANELRVALQQAIGDLPTTDRETLERVLRDEELLGAADRKRKQRAIERLKALWRQVHGND
jgi:RNA polymerase sigma factor (sigma-70 family)